MADPVSGAGPGSPSSCLITHKTVYLHAWNAAVARKWTRGPDFCIVRRFAVEVGAYFGTIIANSIGEAM